MPRVLVGTIAAVPYAILLLPVFAIALAVLLFSAVVRAVGRLLEPSSVPWPHVIAFDRVLGWKPRPNLDAHYLAENDDVYRVVTDGEGFPGRRSLRECSVIAIGDSFAFGYGIDSSRTFAEVGRLAVKAIGAPGYSMVQSVLLLEQLAARLNGKLVVWLVYSENDLQDNLVPELRGYRAPFARRRRDGAWEIVSHHLAPTPWRCSDFDRRRLFPRMCVPGPLADRAYAACDYLIERAAHVCHAVGAHLAIITIPHPMQLTSRGVATLKALSGSPALCDARFPDSRIAESCRRHRVTMLAGMDYLAAGDYKRREGIHWNARGHRRMATMLTQLYASFTSGSLEKATPRDVRTTAAATLS